MLLASASRLFTDTRSLFHLLPPLQLLSRFQIRVNIDAPFPTVCILNHFARSIEIDVDRKMIAWNFVLSGSSRTGFSFAASSTPCMGSVQQINDLMIAKGITARSWPAATY
jgi:hypothetical protein